MRELDPVLGVVIPTLNEAARLPLLLGDLDMLAASGGAFPRHRVVVVDAGSADDTVAVAHRSGAEVIDAPPGRASQMNAGAGRLLGVSWLLFLHADCRMGPSAREAVRRHVARGPAAPAAYFRFELEGSGWFWRFLEAGQRIRERLCGLVYGDQGLLVPREAFDAVGGFPDQPLMEDVEIVRTLRTRWEIERLPASLPTSPRRYEREGRWSGWLRNTALVAAYLMGVSADRLVRWYAASTEECTGHPAPERRILMVFAKAPVAGRVKTRLAAEIGDEEALRIYRRMGRSIVDRVREGPYRTIVYYDPPGSLDRVRAWLGAEALEFRSQEGLDLGERMERAFAESLAEADAVCVIGVDSPRLKRATVLSAFDALAGADVVFGPATDGGYYLLALRHAHPELFRGIPWSTERVLSDSAERGRSLGLRIVTLDPLGDVDTAADLARELGEPA